MATAIGPATPAKGLGDAVYQNYKLRLAPQLRDASPIVDPNADSTSVNRAALAKALAARGNGIPTAQVPTLPSTTVDKVDGDGDKEGVGDFDPTMLLGGAAGVGAGYALYRALRGRSGKPAGVVNSPAFGAPKDGQLSGPGIKASLAGNKQKRLAAPSSIIEGEFSEIPSVIADQRMPAQLEQHGTPATRAEIAKRKLRNAAVGTTNSEAIPVKGVINEDPLAGLARTIGVEPNVAKTLRANPGLAEILARRIGK